MSISITFVARTGIVMGTDSRVTSRGPYGTTREDAYPKLVQFGDAPVALAMVGAGFYGGRDFRSLVAETHHRWAAESSPDYSVEGIAEIFARTAGEVAREAGDKATMTVQVGGYSPEEPFGELWEVELPGGGLHDRARDGRNTFVWRGQTEAVTTLWWGVNRRALNRAMKAEGLSDETIQAVERGIHEQCAWGPERINWGMPLSSAVALVRHQLELQIAYERFLPDKASCGPPVQLLAINDAGVKWIESPFGRFADIGATQTS